MADKKGRINSIITRNLCDIIMKEMQDPIVKLIYKQKKQKN